MGERLEEITMLQNKNVCVKMCLSSRPLNEFKDLFQKCPRFQIDEWTREDISTYVQERLNKNRRYRQLIESPIANTEALSLIQNIVTSAEGVFLWVRLVVDDILEGLTDGLFMSELLQRLSRLPRDLSEFFFHSLHKIKDRYRVNSFIMFESVIRSNRPLLLHELIMIKEVARGHHANSSRAIGKDLNDVEFNNSAYNVEGMKRQLRSHGGLFLEVRKKTHLNFETDHTVQFLHRTVKEFFLTPSTLESLIRSREGNCGLAHPDGNGHTFILEYCLQAAEFATRNLFRNPDYPRALDLIDAISFHCPAAEKTLPISLVEFYDGIDARLSQHHPLGIQWPQESWLASSLNKLFLAKQIPVNFLLHAVSTNMLRYVAAKISAYHADGHRHETLVLTGDGLHSIPPLPEMAALLLQNGASSTFSDKRSVIGSLRYTCVVGNERKYVEWVKTLLAPCDVNSTVWNMSADEEDLSGTPILHYIIGNPDFSLASKLELLGAFLEHRVDLDKKDDLGMNLLSMLSIGSRSEKLFSADRITLIKWILHHGGHIEHIALVRSDVRLVLAKVLEDPRYHNRKYFDADALDYLMTMRKHLIGAEIESEERGPASFQKQSLTREKNNEMGDQTPAQSGQSRPQERKCDPWEWQEHLASQLS
jgi:hypothetical protein